MPDHSCERSPLVRSRFRLRAPTPAITRHRTWQNSSAFVGAPRRDHLPHHRGFSKRERRDRPKVPDGPGSNRRTKAWQLLQLEFRARGSVNRPLARPRERTENRPPRMPVVQRRARGAGRITIRPEGRPQKLKVLPEIRRPKRVPSGFLRRYSFEISLLRYRFNGIVA